jgi:hypothetical protein
MRSRLLFVAGVAGVLAALIAAILVFSGGEERSFAEAPPDCVSAWNDDPSAVALGRHQTSIHGYIDVEVAMLLPGGTDPGAGETGDCAVVFAAGTLDPEVSAAAQIRRGGAWRPLSDTAATDRLAELQARAGGSYNAQLTPDGTIEPL